jgi:hypothetical protein
MNFLRFFLIVILSVVLVSCPSNPMRVEVLSSTTKNISVEMFFRQEGWSNQKYAPKISKIYFSKSLSESKREMPMWSIQCKDEKACKIMRVTYGELPNGFIEIEPKQPIHVGDALLISFWSRENPPGELGTVEIKVH